MDSPVTVDQLRVIAAIADEGSFSAAARKLRRTQGAISYNVATLESLLEVALFDRSGHRPVITEAGKTVLSQARGLLERLAVLQATAKSMREGLEPALALAVDTLFPSHVLAAVLHDFGERYPTVQLDLRTGILSTVTSLVENGTCALGITGVASLADHFVVAPCASVELVAVAAPEHPLAREPRLLDDVRLREYTNIVLSDHASAAGPQGNVNSQSVWRINDSSVRHDLVRAGLGWARMPLEQVREEVKSGVLVRLRTKRWQKNTRVPLSTVYLNENPPGPAGTWLLKRVGGKS
jgi:DNA-binding transcriptional LysR family regulator